MTTDSIELPPLPAKYWFLRKQDNMQRILRGEEPYPTQLYSANQMREYALLAIQQEREIISLIEQHGIWLTRFPSGMWGADIPGEAGDPDANPDPKPGEPGHVKSTATGPTVSEAVRKCAAAIRKG